MNVDEIVWGRENLLAWFAEHPAATVHHVLINGDSVMIIYS